MNTLWLDVIYTIAIVSADIQRRKTNFEEKDELDSGDSYLETFKRLPLSPLVLLFCSFVLVGLTALVFYHYYLGATFQTTYEHRKSTHSQYNWRPFDTGSRWQNLKQRIFMKKSKLPILRPLELYDPDV